MSNRLIRAAHGLTLSEKRLVAAAVSQINSKIVAPEGPLAIRVRAVDFAETYGVDMSNAYEALAKAAKPLESRRIRWTEPGHRGNMREVSLAWVYKATYAHGEGWIELCFPPELKPHLTLLRKEFTKYQLAQAGALRSVYSWRLLELLHMMKGKSETLTGWLAMSIEEFEEAMDAPPSCRSNFKDLKRRVLLPAVEELRLKNQLDVKVTTKTTGRKVTGLRFDFSPNPQADMFAA